MWVELGRRGPARAPHKRVTSDKEKPLDLTGGRVNLKSLADELNLSKTTVSRALNGFPEVSERTRRRVEAAAEKLGYFPNKSASRLARGKVGAIGLIVDANRDSFMDPILAEFLDGVGRELAKTETDLVIQPVAEREIITAYKRAIAENTVDGFILNAPTEFDPRVEYLAKVGFPFVLHGRTKGAEPHCFFDIDNEQGFFDATRHFLDFGHRRLCIIGGFGNQTFTIDRLAGARRALAQDGLELWDQNLWLGPMSERTGYEAGQHYLKLSDADRPTAFLCMSPFVAVGLIRAARSLGAKVPDDLSIILHDDRQPYLRSEFFDPPLTALQSSIRMAGGTVARMLKDRISQGATAEVVQVVHSVDLHKGMSVGAPPFG